MAFVPVTDISRGPTYLNVSHIVSMCESQNGPPSDQKVYQPGYGWIDAPSTYYTDILMDTRQIITVEESFDLMIENVEKAEGNPSDYH